MAANIQREVDDVTMIIDNKRLPDQMTNKENLCFLTKIATEVQVRIDAFESDCSSADSCA